MSCWPTASNAVLLGLEHARRARLLEALGAGELDDAAVRREVAAQDREAAVGLDRIARRANDHLAGRLLGVRRLLADRAAGDGERVGVQDARLGQPLRRSRRRRRPRRGRSRRICPPGLRSASSGVARRSARSRRCPARCRPRGRPRAGGARRWSSRRTRTTAAIAFSIESAVMILLGRRSSFEGLDHEPAGLAGDLVLVAVHRRDHRASPSARCPSPRTRSAIVLAVNWPPHAPGAGTRAVLELQQVVVGHVARGVRADRLEDVLDRHVLPAPAARRDRAAVEHHRGHVQAGERHHRAGDRLVAARHRDDGVELVAAHDQLDRVGDHLAADQRGLHPLGAHRDAVGDRDRVELHRRAAGLADRPPSPPPPARAGGSCTASPRSRCWRCRPSGVAGRRRRSRCPSCRRAPRRGPGRRRPPPSRGRGKIVDAAVSAAASQRRLRRSPLAKPDQVAGGLARVDLAPRDVHVRHRDQLALAGAQRHPLGEDVVGVREPLRRLEARSGPGTRRSTRSGARRCACRRRRSAGADRAGIRTRRPPRSRSPR